MSNKRPIERHWYTQVSINSSQFSIICHSFSSKLWNTRGDLSYSTDSWCNEFPYRENSHFSLQTINTTWKLSEDSEQKYILSHFNFHSTDNGNHVKIVCRLWTKSTYSLISVYRQWTPSKICPRTTNTSTNCLADRWRARFQQEWVAGCQSWRSAAPACAWLPGWPAPTGHPPLPLPSGSAAASAPLQQLQATGWHHHLLLLSLIHIWRCRRR